MFARHIDEYLNVNHIVKIKLMRYNKRWYADIHMINEQSNTSTVFYDTREEVIDYVEKHILGGQIDV